MDNHNDPQQLKLLQSELKQQVIVEDYEYEPGKVIKGGKKYLDPIPYLDWPDKITLLFSGLEITLKQDGTWHWDDTTGG